MCGRFEQAGTRRYYAAALGVDTSNSREWLGDTEGRYNVYPTLCPWMILLHKGKPQFIGMTWGYRTPEEAAAKKKTWINARVEKALTGRYFRHMFREGRVIILAGAGSSGCPKGAGSNPGTSADGTGSRSSWPG